METILIGMIAGFTATVILSGIMLIKDTMGLVRVDMIGMLPRGC